MLVPDGGSCDTPGHRSWGGGILFYPYPHSVICIPCGQDPCFRARPQSFRVHFNIRFSKLYQQDLHDIPITSEVLSINPDHTHCEAECFPVSAPFTVVYLAR